MLSTRTLILNEPPPPEAASIASRSVQDFIFAFIFGFFRTIAESIFDFFKIVILPVAIGVNVWQLYNRTRRYSQNKNKTLWQDLSLLGDFVATGLESTAVLLILSAVMGGAVLSAFIIPALFVAGIALRWLDNCAQSIYWGAKVLFGEKGTKQQEENWSNLKKSLRGLAIFTAAGLVIGLLMLSPAAGLLIPLYATTLVQAVGTLVIAVNAFFAGREAYRVHQKKHPQGLLFKKKYVPLDASLELEQVDNSSKLNTLSTADIYKDIGFGYTETDEQQRQAASESGQEQVAAVLGQKLKAAIALRSRYQEKNYSTEPKQDRKKYYFIDIRENHIDDLLRKIEADATLDGPKRLVLDFLGQAKKALAESLDYRGVTPALDNNSMLLDIKGKPWDHQKQKRKDKLHAVLLLEQLVINCQATNNKGVANKAVIIRQEGMSEKWISNVTELLDYFKKTGKEKKLFESLFTPTGVGATQKLFVAVDVYLRTSKFQPTTDRDNYLDAQSCLGMQKQSVG